MEITKVACNGCGAALEIPANARFVTCRFCGASLEIKRTESAVFSEVLDRIDQRTAAIAEDVGAIRRSTEVEQLDREWEISRNSLMVRGKNGTVSEPTTGVGLMMIFGGGGFGIFWTIMAISITSGASSARAPGAFGLFPLVGVVVTIGSVVGGFSMMSKAQRFKEQEAQYQFKRAQLLADQQDAPRGSRR